MFVGDEVLLEVSFPVARDRLARLAASGVFIDASHDAYSYEWPEVRVGIGGLSKLVRVQVRELAQTHTAARFAIRWEATGQGGRLFPVLDADITLTPAGERVALLTIAGSYRPPLGSFGEALDRAILHRVATATISSFLARVAAQIGAHAGGAAEASASNGAGSAEST